MSVKRVKTCRCQHTSNIEISHRCVKTKKTRLSSLHVADVSPMQSNVRVTTARVAFTIDLHLIGNSVQYACSAHFCTRPHRNTEESRKSKTRAKDDESRDVTFQYVITRHSPRYLPLHPSRIGAASLTRLMSVDIVCGNQEHRPHQVTVCQRPKLSSLDHQCWQRDRSSLRHLLKLTDVHHFSRACHGLHRFCTQQFCFPALALQLHQRTLSSGGRPALHVDADTIR